MNQSHAAAPWRPAGRETAEECSVAVAPGSEKPSSNMVLHRCRRHNTFGSTRFRPAHKLLLKALGRPKGAGGGRGQALNDDGTGETEDRTMGGRRARRAVARSRSAPRRRSCVRRPRLRWRRHARVRSAGWWWACLARGASPCTRRRRERLRLPLGCGRRRRMAITPRKARIVRSAPTCAAAAAGRRQRAAACRFDPRRRRALRGARRTSDAAAPLAGRACALAVFLPVLPKLSARALVPPPADANSPQSRTDFR